MTLPTVRDPFYQLVESFSVLNAIGISKFAWKLKPFMVAFQPYLDDISGAERNVRDCATMATMERTMHIKMLLDEIKAELSPLISKRKYKGRVKKKKKGRMWRGRGGVRLYNDWVATM